MTVQPSGIIFDAPYNTYFAGQTVSGRIELVFDKPKKVRGVLLHISGAAKVRYTRQENTSRHTRTTTFTSCEEYFKMKHYCIGGKDHDTIVLPPGTHTYSFSYVLPPVLPSSFEGQYGNIRYIAKIVLERPWKFNQETKTAFTVICPYNLNMFPTLMVPMKVSEEKFFCCCCCKNGPLTAVMMIPKTGFVCGERIPILIEVDNASNVAVPHVTLKLQLFTIFYALQPRKDNMKQTVVFEKMKLGAVEPKNSKSWSQTMLIPPLPPSSMGGCSVIQSEYQLFLEASGGTTHANLKTIIPITIGTVPMAIENTTAPPEPSSPPPDYDTAVGGSSPGIGWANSGPSAPPTQTLAENQLFNVTSIADEADSKHTLFNNNSKVYTPYYPTYNFNYDGK